MTPDPDAWSPPAWLASWPTAYPRPDGDWTVAGSGRFGRLDPGTGAVIEVDPAADRRLPALARAMRHGQLLGYRVERRAVVATPEAFLKIVRPSRLSRLVAIHEVVGAMVGPSLAVPTVVVTDEEGAVSSSIVPGCSLHSLLRQGAGDGALVVAAAAMAALHDAPRAASTPGRSDLLTPASADPAARWVDVVARAEPAAAPSLAPTAAAVDAAVGALAPLDPADLVVVHGDCHDKNVFVDGASPGLIDLDGVRLGAREDDVANLAVHVALRALQAGRPVEHALGRRDATIAAYRRLAPLDDHRMVVTEAATWFRLACLYRFRATSRPLVPVLLTQTRSALGQLGGATIGR